MDDDRTFEVECPYEDCDEVLVVDEAARAYASATFDCDTCDRRVGLHFGKPYRVAREHAPTLGCLCCGRDEAVS